jgi:hypothetical protein
VVGETANHMGYVKSNENGKFQNFEPHLSMVNQLFSKFVQLRKCGEPSYLFITEKYLDLDKNSAFGDFSKSYTHGKNAVVGITAVVQTSIKHGKSTFFKICSTKKMWGIKLTLRSKNPFVI